VKIRHLIRNKSGKFVLIRRSVLGRVVVVVIIPVSGLDRREWENNKKESL